MRDESMERSHRVFLGFQDRYLPVHNVGRIMKDTLPQNAKISKDSKDAMNECVSEFISFLTSEASDRCRQQDRKTMTADDLLWAMSMMGFEQYVDPMKVYINKYKISNSRQQPNAEGEED